MGSMNKNRVSKGVSEGGQFSRAGKAEASGVSLANDGSAFESSLNSSGMDIEDFERIHGPKSFTFYSNRVRRTYTFALNADGTEHYEGVDMSSGTAEKLQERLSWDFGYDLDKARSDAQAPARAIFDEVQRIREMPLEPHEVEARHERHARESIRAFKALGHDFYGESAAYYRLLGSDREEFIRRWDADAERGACARHAKEVAEGRYVRCYPCRVAFAAAARQGKLNPPQPIESSRAQMPARPSRGEMISQEWDEDDSSQITTTRLEADDRLSAALRKYLNVDDGTPVDIIMEETESGADSTLEHYQSIEVKAGDQSASFDDLGDLMRRLDGALRGDLRKKAVQFMGPSFNEGPCYVGPAAIRVHQQFGNGPVFVGWILNYFPQKGEIEFQHVDGRHRYLLLSGISDIVPTDRTVEHPGHRK